MGLVHHSWNFYVIYCILSSFEPQLLRLQPGVLPMSYAHPNNTKLNQVWVNMYNM